VLLSNTKISNVSCCDPFLKKQEKASCVWLEDQTEKWLSVSGAVMREKAMAIKAGFRTA
jgi:hypothetical protein